MYGKADIKFKDGSKMQEVQEVTYLGGKLTNKASRHVEVISRINKALQTCMKLKFFWSKTKCSIGWKMQIYNAIIIAQLTYGLSTVQLTNSLLDRLDAFQMRGLRYILGIEHSSYSGISNEEVYERVNIALNEGIDLNIEWSDFMSAHKFADIKTMEKVSDFIMRQQNSLYGHIIMADEGDIMRRITITEELEPPKRDVLRSGRPRESWVYSNNKYAMKTHCNEEYNSGNENQVEIINFLAHSRVMGSRNLENWNPWNVDINKL